MNLKVDAVLSQTPYYIEDEVVLRIMKKNGIPTNLVTKEKTMIVKQWAKKMSVKKLYDGIVKK